MSKKPTKLIKSSRQLACRWLTLVVSDGRSVNDLLARHDLCQQLSSSEQAFAKQILFGSLRYFHQLKAILDQLVEKPLKQKDQDVQVVLIMGIYQLRYLSVPDHAAISETVELTKTIGKSWASGLVNGCLRNYLRQLPAIETKLAKAKTYLYSHPNWLIKQFESDWGERASAILEANNQQAPMCLRVNQQKITRADYLTELAENSIQASAHPLASDAVVLASACDVYQLPGFEQGKVTVQDAAAQLPVELMDLKPGLKVLDGCAAPGGKTTHILQRQPTTQLDSVEMSEKRLPRIRQTLQRLGFDCRLHCADILQHAQWWDGQLFDRILIDVPCSASGVIRRNPDIKLHRLKTDIAALVKLQAEILSSSWQLLKPGGRLVYATCSVFKAENQKQIEAFLAEHSAHLVSLPASLETQLNREASVGYQLFPGELMMDGFYLCALEKPS